MWEGNKNLNNNQYRLASSVLFFFRDSHHRVFSLPFFREGKRGRKRKKNINAWLPFMRPHRGIWPTTQACALTGTRTGDPVVCRLTLNPLSHASQGAVQDFLKHIFAIWGELRSTKTSLRFIYLINPSPTVKSPAVTIGSSPLTSTSPTPFPLVTTIVLSVPEFQFYIPHMSEIIWFLTFSI